MAKLTRAHLSQQLLFQSQLNLTQCRLWINSKLGYGNMHHLQSFFKYFKYLLLSNAGKTGKAEPPSLRQQPPSPERDILKIKATKLNAPNDFMSYKRQRNITNKEIRLTKQAYYQNSFNEHTGDSPKTWQTIDELTSRKSGNQ